MSIQAMQWALGFPAENATEKAILLVIANYADGNGRSYPGQQNIAEQASSSERTVRRVLESLEARGIIAREERRRKDGSRTSDVIVLASFQQAANLAGSDDTNRPSCPNQPATVSGLTSFEPSEEPLDSLSETSSDAPKLAKKRKDYPQAFEAVWREYPTDANMSKKEAFDAFKRLDQADVAALAASIPAFRAYCRSNPDYRPIHMCRFIKFRRFDGFAPQSQPVPDIGARWEARLRLARERRQWPTVEFGPMPGQTGCLVPASMLAEGDGIGWSEWKSEAA